jgi:hypothetical protein
VDGVTVGGVTVVVVDAVVVDVDVDVVVATVGAGPRSARAVDDVAESVSPPLVQADATTSAASTAPVANRPR